MFWLQIYSWPSTPGNKYKSQWLPQGSPPSTSLFMCYSLAVNCKKTPLSIKSKECSGSFAVAECSLGGDVYGILNPRKLLLRRNSRPKSQIYRRLKLSVWMRNAAPGRMNWKYFTKASERAISRDENQPRGGAGDDWRQMKKIIMPRHISQAGGASTSRRTEMFAKRKLEAFGCVEWVTRESSSALQMREVLMQNYALAKDARTTPWVAPRSTTCRRKSNYTKFTHTHVLGLGYRRVYTLAKFARRRMQLLGERGI